MGTHEVGQLRTCCNKPEPRSHWRTSVTARDEKTLRSRRSVRNERTQPLSARQGARDWPARPSIAACHLPPATSTRRDHLLPHPIPSARRNAQPRGCCRCDPTGVTGPPRPPRPPRPFRWSTAPSRPDTPLLTHYRCPWSRPLSASSHPQHVDPQLCCAVNRRPETNHVERTRRRGLEAVRSGKLPESVSFRCCCCCADCGEELDVVSYSGSQPSPPRPSPCPARHRFHCPALPLIEPSPSSRRVPAFTTAWPTDVPPTTPSPPSSLASPTVSPSRPRTS